MATWLCKKPSLFTVWSFLALPPIANESYTKRYLQCYKQQFSSHFTCPEFTPGLPYRWCPVNFRWVTWSYRFPQEIWANAHETRDSISLISYAGCLGLSQVISAKIHSKCASQPEIAKNSLKTAIFGIQGRSRSSMLVPLERSSAVLVMICSKSEPVCNRSHARRANTIVAKLRFIRGYPSLMSSFVVNLLTQPHQITSLETSDCRLSYGVNPESQSHLALNPYRVVTDGRTDRRTEFSYLICALTCRNRCRA